MSQFYLKQKDSSIIECDFINRLIFKKMFTDSQGIILYLFN